MTKKYGTPGPRVMKPEVATDPSVARCSLGAQLLFDRLIVASDDQGRQIGDDIVVKATCFPRTSEATVGRVRRWLAELSAERLIIRYVADGEPLIQLTGWWRHQDNQRRIFPSRWAAPDGWTDVVKVEPGRIPSDAGQRPPNGDEDAATWDALGAPNAGQTRATGAPNAGRWPRKVSPSPMPHAGASAGASAGAGASSPGSTEALGAVGRANGRVDPVEGSLS